MKKNICLIIFIGIIAQKIWTQEPLSQPTNFIFSSIKPYSFNISFTSSSSDGYLILRSTSPFTGSPIDGTTYEKGGGIGNAKVFSTTSATFANIKEVNAGITYYFTVYAYNGSSSTINYLQLNPLTASVTTTENKIGNYYQGINENASTFITDLHNLLQSTHTFIAYSLYDDNIVPSVFERDTVGGKKLVQCAYSNMIVKYNAPFNFSTTDFSREHCLARSWMPSSPTTSDEEAADYHNLLLTNLTNANGPRSNYPVGEVITPTFSFMDCKLGYNNFGAIVFEPAENIKGDLARSMFYEILSWNGTGGSSWAIENLLSYGANQNIDVLLNWHFADLPDGAEKAKTEYIYFLQGNRNPFVDYPEWVNCIDFYQLLLLPSCNTSSGIENDPNHQIKLYPNPVTNKIYIETQYLYPNTTVNLFDINGLMVKSHKLKEEITNNNFTMDVGDLNCGVYILKIETNNQFIIKKIIKQN